MAIRVLPRALTIAETSGRSRALIKKIVFELLDVGNGKQAQVLWTARDVPVGDTISLVTGMNGHAPWFEVASNGDAPRLSVTISFVDDAGRGGLITAIAPVDRE